MMAASGLVEGATVNTVRQVDALQGKELTRSPQDADRKGQDALDA